MVVLGCFEMWLLFIVGDGLEPPLLFKDSQPQIRSFVGGVVKLDDQYIP